MKKVVLILLAVLGALAVVAGVLFVLIGLLAGLGKGRVANDIVLEIDFESGVIEYMPDDPFSKLLGLTPLSTRDVVDALHRAADDDRVVGLVARIGAGGMGLAQIQGVRDAVQVFRDSGKPAIAYAETFGEVGPSNTGYYLATVFDEIYLQPSGDIGLTGLIYESPFIRGTLDKLDIVPHMGQRYEYKNAMNMYTDTSFTDAHREALARVMESQFGQIVRGIAVGRELAEDDVRTLIDGGPFLGGEAVDAGLVDALAYRDEVYDVVSERTGSDRLLFLSKYLGRAGRPDSKGETVALIYGVGAVTRGSSEFNPLLGAQTMGSDSVASALRAAVADDDVRAIVFRVDSPGGSYVASDAIWRETIRAKEAGKPVIVTMGNVAGSGGYFVAMAADKIIAEPGTITGSIGVLGGKMITKGFWEKMGITFDEVHTSENATMWSSDTDYSASEWKRFDAWLDRVYEDFTAKVAEGRGLPLETVQQIAKGRIWSGEDALELGLIDELGGFPAAYRLAREAAGLEPDAPIRIKLFPRPVSPLQALTGEGPDNSRPGAEAAAIAEVFEMVRPAVRLAHEVGLGPEPGVLTMPAIRGAE